MKATKTDAKPHSDIQKCHGDVLSMTCTPKAKNAYAALDVNTGKLVIKTTADAESVKAICTIVKKSKDGKSNSIKVDVQITALVKPSACKLSDAGFPFVADPRATPATTTRPIVLNGAAKVTDFDVDCKKDVIKMIVTPEATFVKLDPKTGAVSVTPTKDTKPGKYDILLSRTSVDGKVETKKMSFTVPEPPKPACPLITSNFPAKVKVSETKSLSILRADGSDYNMALCLEKFEIVSVGPDSGKSFFKIDPKTGKIVSTPTDLVASAQNYKIGIKVTDKNGKSTVETVEVTLDADCGTRGFEPIKFPKAISTSQTLKFDVPTILKNDSAGTTWTEKCGYGQVRLEDAPPGVSFDGYKITMDGTNPNLKSGSHTFTVY